MKALSTTHCALGALLLLLAGGCWTPSYYVDVYLSPHLKETYKVYPSIEVDIVGADKNDAERLESCDVDDYFEVGDPLRKSTPHATLHFTETDILPKRLSTWDPIWDVFDDKDANQFYVMVNLPKVAPKAGAKKKAKSEPKEGRRIVMPLEPKNWFLQIVWPWYYRTRAFEITPAGVNCLGNAPEGAPEPVVERSKLVTGDER